MESSKKQLGYSSVIFYSFSLSFFILGIWNAFFPISNFKMTVLSLVALLFSLQQMYEAIEEVDSKVAELEKKVANQEDLLVLVDSSVQNVQKPKKSSKISMKSKNIFAAGLILLVVGLTLDFDFPYAAFANTATIVSFSVLFVTMGYKEKYMNRINQINEELFATDKRIIAKLKEQIGELEQL